MSAFCPESKSLARSEAVSHSTTCRPCTVAIHPPVGSRATSSALVLSCGSRRLCANESNCQSKILLRSSEEMRDFSSWLRLT